MNNNENIESLHSFMDISLFMEIILKEEKNQIWPQNIVAHTWKLGCLKKFEEWV